MAFHNNQQRRLEAEQLRQGALGLSSRELLVGRQPLQEMGSWQRVGHTCGCLVSKLNANDAVKHLEPCSIKELAGSWKKRHEQQTSSRLSEPRRAVPGRRPPLQLCSSLGKCYCQGNGKFHAAFQQKLLQFARQKCQDVCLRQGFGSASMCVVLRGHLANDDVALALESLLHLYLSRDVLSRHTWLCQQHNMSELSMLITWLSACCFC